jgi:hypothetical protein
MKRKRNKSVSLAWITVLVIGSLAGYVAAVLALSPNISVVPPTVFDKIERFSAPFRVKNDGFLSIHDVEYSCKPNEVKFRSNPFKVDMLHGFVANRIGPGENATFLCDWRQGDMMHIESADLSIIVSFRPSFLWFQINESFHYTLERYPDNLYYWNPRPESL